MIAAEIVLAPTDTDVELGSTVIFTCVAISTPTPMISWTRNGVLLSNETDPRTSVYFDTFNQSGLVFAVATLELCGVTVDDVGKYTCTASEGGANTTVYFSLNIVEEGKLYIIYHIHQAIPCYNILHVLQLSSLGSSDGRAVVL